MSPENGAGISRNEQTSHDRRTKITTLLLRIDTPIEVDYDRNGGILPFVLKELVSKA